MTYSSLFPTNSYLNRFFAEKEISDEVYEITDSRGLDHFIETGAVIETIASCPPHELKKIANTIRKIDFYNGNLHDFFRHLATAMAEMYNGVCR